MMRLSHTKIFLSLFLLIQMAVYGLSSTTISITGDNVNLRSYPTNNAEVVGQVSTGDRLECTGRVGEWLQVVPPQRVDCWVYDEFIVDNKVAVNRLKVRCGPGINYRVVGMLNKNDRVVSRGVKGEWHKIDPPASSRIWVHSHYAVKAKDETAENASSGPGPNVQESAKQAVATPRKTLPEKHTSVTRRPRKSATAGTSVTAREKRDLSRYIDVDRLQDDVEQGAIVKRSGVLKPAGLAWRRPSEYRLVVYDKWDRAVTICYVLVDESKLSVMLDKDVYLIGNEYWIKGVRYPVVIVNSIILND